MSNNTKKTFKEAFSYTLNYDKIPNLKRKLENDEPIFLEAVIQRANARNQNGRVYPRHELEREFKRYKAEEIKENRALGELDHPCFMPDAQILSKSGWKNITDIEEGEEVLTFNPDENIYEYQKVSEKIISPFKGNMKNLKHRNLDITVTPNHKFVLKGRSDNPKTKNEFSLVEVRNFDNHYKSRLIKSEPDSWVGEYQEYIEVADEKIKSEDWVAFIGIFVSDGYTSYNKDQGHYKVGIAQRSYNKEYDSIKSLLEKLPFNFRENKNGTGFIAHNKKLYEAMKPIGKTNNKNVPDYIKNFSTDLLEIFVEWAIKGDGSVIHDKKRPQDEPKHMFYSTSKRLADDFQEICFKIGVPVSIMQVEPDDRMIEGREIKAENSQTLYRLTRNKTNYIYNDKRHLKITDVPYEGDVYCVTVPNHTIVVRENECGIPLISGNSERTIVEYKTASHRVVDYWWKGDDVIGKIEILSGKYFPCANILRGCLKNNIPIGFSSRGLGDEVLISDDTIEVEDYDLICIDAVPNPSTIKAFGTLLEGRDAKNKFEVSQILNEVQTTIFNILK